MEIKLRDPSQFAVPIAIKGEVDAEGRAVLIAEATSVPNAVAVTAMEAERIAGLQPDVYFEWSPGTPWREMFRFIFLGTGQNAVVTREMLRRAVPDIERRPRIHLC